MCVQRSDETELWKFIGSPRNPFGTHSSYQFPGGKEGYRKAWVIFFSQYRGGALTPAASGPIRGTVRRVEMIAAAMKPPCNLPPAEEIGPRPGPPSPLPGSFPEKPSDYGLPRWRKPETPEDREGIKLSCDDLEIIKRAAVAEIKRRIADREKQSQGSKRAEGRKAEGSEGLWGVCVGCGRVDFEPSRVRSVGTQLVAFGSCPHCGRTVRRVLSQRAG